MGKREVAILGGASLIGLGVALAIRHVLARPVDGAQYALILEATSGGTTNPPPDTYISDVPTSMEVEAIPDAGYEFDGWYLKGVNVSKEFVYTVEINERVLLMASFFETGAPPLIPDYVKPTQNCNTDEWYKVTSVIEGAAKVLRFGVLKYITGYVKYKICDAAGNGVRGQGIALYTEPNPDILGYGYVYLNDVEHTEVNPLILISNTDGVVAVKVTYKWLETGERRYTIGMGAKAHWVCLKGISEADTYPIADGQAVIIPCYWESLTRVKHPVLGTNNPVHAYWVDNPNLPVWGDAIASCVVRIDNKLYI